MFFIVLFAYYFLNHKFNFNISCIFHEITGFYCPGCEITRMFFSLIQLDFYQAFRYNPLTFCLLVLYLLYSLIYFITYKIYNYKITINPKWYYLILIIVIVFGILRNMSAFDFLKPTIL